MQVTAQHLKGLGVIDRIVPEPIGGAHREPVQAIANLGAAIGEELDALSEMSPHELRTDRADKFLAIGA
jgi:acetyl-CoA carboxylase carboxyl transferase subunit alpha